MISLLSSLEEIHQELTDKQIPFSAPAFYDHPNFLTAEQDDSDYLRIYALFVQKRQYSEEYLRRAEEEIVLIASILYEELVRDGKLGACVDANMVL